VADILVRRPVGRPAFPISMAGRIILRMTLTPKALICKLFLAVMNHNLAQISTRAGNSPWTIFPLRK